MNEKHSKFPSIALCNSNPFIIEYAVDFLTRIIENKMNVSYSSSSRNLTKLEFVNQFYFQNSQLINQARYSARNDLNETEKQKLGLKLDEFLIDCKLNSATCNRSDFTWGYSWELGNCFIFNYRKSYEIKSPGKYAGLTLEIFTGFEELAPFFYTF